MAAKLPAQSRGVLAVFAFKLLLSSEVKCASCEREGTWARSRPRCVEAAPPAVLLLFVNKRVRARGASRDPRRHWPRRSCVPAARASPPPPVAAYTCTHLVAERRDTRTTDAIANSDSLFVYFSLASFGPFCFRGSETKKKRRRGWIERPEKIGAGRTDNRLRHRLVRRSS
ncbi:unnamed protein product [Arctia plantaginis]|uniref:Secreted protein n=1 Tax=Arctia plantaginis TaxID=874455 RepID=A0A8S1AE73_ARCPL|nr:unnamed protein product [Arctia plantaginis]